MTVKELPLGNQSFAELINLNRLYSDKTGYILSLLESAERNYFLSRLRRFGKTLLLHTMKEILTGNRGLFKGLLIDESGYDFPRHPVLFLSLSTRSNRTKTLSGNLMDMLEKIANKAELNVKGLTPDRYFGTIIESLSEKHRSQAAAFINEYDHPVARHMANRKLAEANAGALHDFFAILKESKTAPRVRFTFVTGLTRQALASMDFRPNHLNYTSLDPLYAGIRWFTLDEFYSLISNRMEDALTSLKKKGAMFPTDDVSELKAEILRWDVGKSRKDVQVSFSFKLPNPDVSTAYYDECFKLFFELPKRDLATEKEKPRKAPFAGNSREVSRIFRVFFAKISYFQKPKDEITFHSLVRFNILGMGFDTASELSGSTGRPDSRVKFSEIIFVIIEFKYCPAEIKISIERENEILAKLALDSFTIDEVDEIIAALAITKFNVDEYHQFLSQKRKEITNTADQNWFSSEEALKKLPKAERELALAEACKKKPPPNELEKAILIEAAGTINNAVKIDNILAKASRKALNDIIKGKYRGFFEKDANDFIDLGLSLHGNGRDVKALFVPLEV
ncbi:MAG: AAA family ATPase [Deltaproteobacteria bacterium]|jgi:hypothetical protein|nr:AAA family ATPase [Deltaproteobacteria bacterium]